MMKFLTPGLLVINLAISGVILGLAVSGKIVAPPAPAAEDQIAKGDAAPEKPKPMFYYQLKPEIVANFQGQSRPRNMMVALNLVTADEKALESLKLNAPAIRNELLLQFSGLESAPLMTREGKDALRKKALQAIRKIMLERYGSEAVEDVLFTRFVMQ